MAEKCVQHSDQDNLFVFSGSINGLAGLSLEARKSIICVRQPARTAGVACTCQNDQHSVQTVDFEFTGYLKTLIELLRASIQIELNLSLMLPLMRQNYSPKLLMSI